MVEETVAVIRMVRVALALGAALADLALMGPEASALEARVAGSDREALEARAAQAALEAREAQEAQAAQEETIRGTCGRHRPVRIQPNACAKLSLAWPKQCRLMLSRPVQARSSLTDPACLRPRR